MAISVPGSTLSRQAARTYKGPLPDEGRLHLADRKRDESVFERLRRQLKLPPTADTFTPWILGPQVTQPPTITMSGGATIQSPGFTVKMWPSPHSARNSTTVLRVARAPRAPKRLTSNNQPPSSEEVLDRQRREHIRKLGRRTDQESPGP
jgi:hypothetical protein